MTLPSITGQSIVDSITLRLGGMAGAFSVDDLLDAANDGVGSVWAVLKALGEDYFVDDTQSSDSTSEEDYIATWSTASRELDVPANTREIRAIECTTAGYEFLDFKQRSISDDDFQQIRKMATAAGSSVSTDGVMRFAMVGQRKLLMADFPPATLTLKIWRVTSLNSLTIDSTLSEILYPFHRKVVDYAVQVLQLAVSRESMSAQWLQQWQMGVRELAVSASGRVSVSPVFIQEYEGE